MVSDLSVREWQRAVLDLREQGDRFLRISHNAITQKIVDFYYTKGMHMHAQADKLEAFHKRSVAQ